MALEVSLRSHEVSCFLLLTCFEVIFSDDLTSNVFDDMAQEKNMLAQLCSIGVCSLSKSHGKSRWTFKIEFFLFLGYTM